MQTKNVNNMSLKNASDGKVNIMESIFTHYVNKKEDANSLKPTSQTKNCIRKDKNRDSSTCEPNKRTNKNTTRDCPQ